MMHIDALERAARSGMVRRYEPDLDPDQMPMRSLWIATAVVEMLQSADLGPQLPIVRAALKRFVVGGIFSIVAPEVLQTPKSRVAADGDLRALKYEGPNFVEFRFRPPKHDLRLFGTFVARDHLVVNSSAMKAFRPIPGQKPLSYDEHRRRADSFFKLCGLDRANAPTEAIECISNARIIREL